VKAFLAGCTVLLLAAPAGAWRPMRDPPITWAPEDIPVQWYLNQQGSDDLGIDVVEPAVEAGYAEWTDVDCATIVFEYMGRTGLAYDNSPGRFVISWVESGWTAGPEVAGMMISSPAGDHFGEADIVMNGDSSQWSVTGESNTLDVQSITAHEVGHAVGLDDLEGSDHPTSIMHSPYMMGTQVHVLSADDIEGTQTLYPGPCCACTPEEVAACATASCGSGLHACGLDCQWQECYVPDAGDEICDGYDNDCDGHTDEDVCGGCTPTPEACDDRDNDCDTVIDENRVCGPECTPLADTESCDGNDEDCDGVIDDGCSCADGTPARACGLDTGSGSCRAGEQACTGGVWGPCTGAVAPRRELCDGVDNDCDTTTDENACNVDSGGDEGCGCTVVSAGRTAADAGTAVGLALAAAFLTRRRRRPRR